MAIRPGKYNPLKPDIELFDYKSKKRYGLKLEGASALQIGTISQDDSVHIRNVGMRVGDFDEQRSWKAGRGIENLSENASGYWDSQNAWTLTDGHIHQTLLWKFARGLRSADIFMPDNTHSVSWAQLFGSQKYMSMQFTSNGFTADYARLWIRKVGNPGTLTFKLHSETASLPGTVLQTVTVTTLSDVVSVLQKFDWTGTQALTASTNYWISVFGDTNDNKTNHWEIGGYSGGTVGKKSTDGTSWSSASFDLYYFVADADINRKFFSFFLDDQMYIVDQRDDLSSSHLYMNGERGKATSTSSTTLVDTAQSFTVNRYVDAYIKITQGTGVGQVRKIISNTSTSVTVSAWDKTPDTTSEYIIYATDYWKEISSTGLGYVVSQPIVVNHIVYFPQGASTNTRRMIWNLTAHSFSDDGTNKASFMVKTSDVDGVRIWIITNSGSTTAPTITYAAAQAWGNPPTALSYNATSKYVGDNTNQVNNAIEKDSSLYVFKADGIWTTSSSFTMVKLQSGLDKTPSAFNGSAAIAHQQFIFYSWLYSVIRVYGSSHDDIGQDWSGWGLPDGREGTFSSFDSYTSLLLGAVDAGTSGTSSVLGFDGLGWHELIRAYDSGKRIRMVKIQPCQDTRNRQWTDMGGDLVYQEMPLKKGSPRLDSGCRYMHEAVLESAGIDMGTASGLPKFVKEITIFNKNLKAGNEIYVDYQVDDDVHTTSWVNATEVFTSPESTAYLNLSNIRKFAYRLRILSNDNTAPVDVIGVTPNGYARSPYKMVWTLRCRADNITSRGRIVKPDQLMRWLLDNARFPGKIEMLSQYELAHKYNVIIHPPRMFPYKPAQNGQAEESVFTIVLEEA